MNASFALLYGSVAGLLFFAAFVFTALNFFAAVFYGRVSVADQWGWLDLFKVSATELTSVGVRARRCVVVGVAGMSAVSLVSVVVALFIVSR
jgi:hypothetical protein